MNTELTENASDTAKLNDIARKWEAESWHATPTEIAVFIKSAIHGATAELRGESETFRNEAKHWLDENSKNLERLAKSEAANAQMRAALTRWSEAPSEEANKQAFAALSTDVGRGWIPIEDVSRLIELVKDEVSDEILSTETAEALEEFLARHGNKLKTS